MAGVVAGWEGGCGGEGKSFYDTSITTAGSLRRPSGLEIVARDAAAICIQCIRWLEL